MSRVSSIQLDANRQNARRSTGPRTDQGKVRASRNAMKFGIFSSQVLLPGEDAAVYEAFRNGMYLRLKPIDEFERMLADRIVLAAWKLRRVQAAEAARYEYYSDVLAEHTRVNGKMVQTPVPLGKIVSIHLDTFERFAKHEASLERTMYRVIGELRRVQAERGEEDAEREEDDFNPEPEVEVKNEPISPAGASQEPSGCDGRDVPQCICENEHISGTAASGTHVGGDAICKNEPIFAPAVPAPAPVGPPQPVRMSSP